METTEGVSQEQLSKLPIEELAMLSLDALHRVKEEVKDESVEKLKPPLERALGNYDFIDRLRQLPPVKAYLKISNQGITIIKRWFRNPLPHSGSANLVVKSSLIVLEFDYPPGSNAMIISEELRDNWNLRRRTPQTLNIPNRTGVKKLANLSKVNIVETFEKAIGEPKG